MTLAMTAICGRRSSVGKSFGAAFPEGSDGARICRGWDATVRIVSGLKAEGANWLIGCLTHSVWSATRAMRTAGVPG